MKHIAIIPARSGSKGLKDKNIKQLAGKPLLAYSIETAQEAGIFDCIHVSTDSRLYADIAEKYGADVPFLRPADLALDNVGSWDVVEDVLKRYREKGRVFDVVTLLQPTSPLRKPEDILASYEMFNHQGVKAVVAVCEMDHSPIWSNTLPLDHSMENFEKEEAAAYRQGMETYYRINGSIYMVDREFLSESMNERHKIYRKGCYAYLMDREKSIDIDTQLDFEMAEFLISRSCVREKRDGIEGK